MRKADLEKRCKRFLATLDRITDRADRIDKRMRRKSDRRWCYEMLAVSAVTAWSDFAEDLFYMCINRNSTVLSRRLGLDLPKHLTLPMCEALFTTHGFLDFRSVGDLKGTAKKFLGDAHPFGGLPSATSQAIDRLMAARSASRSRRTWALYGATTIKSCCRSGAVWPPRSVHEAPTIL